MNAKILLLALLGMLAYAQARITFADVQAAEWESFKMEFNKNYDDKEDHRHMLMFLNNKRIIDEHNERFASGEESYKMGVNQFTDLFDEEFDSLFAGSVMDAEDDFDSIEDDTEFDFNDDLTEEEDTDFENDLRDHTVDWRTIGAVTPVLNQGHFNTSWAFAVAGVVESRQFVATGKLVTLSKQNLVDCCRTKHKKTMNALKCIKKKGGIQTEASYPYRGLAGKCRFNKKLIGAKINKYYQSSPGNERALVHNVAKGPVVAVISRDAFRFYKKGVFHNPKCSKSPDVSVLIVGYGTCENCGDYWLLKTSLGTSWGEKGYMKIARNRNNICGIASRAYYPIIKH
ncbi:cathepsin L-like [Drosophila innubila]|uniref:cathepsin L-like n=1 Tax=Drosophila innubila TaxID=198719 RepID=UPI00148E1DBC|nr:cathepsin L-like [Drosophila innubila]